MNLHVLHRSYWNCLRTHEIPRVVFGGKTHAFEASQPRYLENPLATGRVAQSTAKSSPCRKYAFFLLGEGKGEVCAVVRINPARSAPGSAGWRGWQVPWAVHARCLPEPLGLPSPPAPHNPLPPLRCSSRTDNLSLRKAPFSGNGTSVFPSDAASATLRPSQRAQAWQGTAACLLLVIRF